MDTSNKHTNIFFVLVLILITSFAYQQIADNSFSRYFDDGRYVVNNPYVHSGFTAKSIIWAFTTNCASNWHPLTWLSHMLDWQLYGSNPVGHHLTNLLFHITNSILVFLILNYITGRPRRSIAVAALFAVHPLHVESVAWVAERKDVLSTFFWLLTMLAYIRYTRQPSVGKYVIIPLIFMLGLLSKPMLVSLPLVLLLIDYWPLNRLGAGKISLWRLVSEKIPLIILAACSCIVTIWAQSSGGSVGSLIVYPLGVRVDNAIISCIIYLEKTFWPVGLSVFYPHPGTGIPIWKIIGSGLLIAAITAYAIRCARSRPYVIVGWLWYLITLLPVIGLMQVGQQGMADRYTYIPLLGIFTALIWIISDLAIHGVNERRDARFRLSFSIFGIIVILILTACTRHQVRYWRNNEALFRHAIAATSGNVLAHYNLGGILLEQGKIDEAIHHYREVLRLSPGSPDAEMNLGKALMERGDLKEARDCFSTALSAGKDPAAAHKALGMVLARLGNFKESEFHYDEAIKIDSSDESAYLGLGNILAAQNKFADAETRYRKAIALRPNFGDAHYKLGLALQYQGRNAESVQEYEKAIMINPNNPKVHSAFAIALYFTGDYARAWKEVDISSQLGIPPTPEFIRRLSKKMSR